MSIDGPEPGDAAELEQLESQLAAVEAAMDALVEIAAGSDDGATAVAQIRAVVNEDRFAVTSGSVPEVPPDSLPGVQSDPMSSVPSDPMPDVPSGSDDPTANQPWRN